MDFTPDPEQEALRDAVRALLAKPYGSIDGRRDATAKDPGWSPEVWGRLADMGVLGLPFAEDDGGAGAGPAEVALAAEQVGRVLAPEPFVEAVVLAGGVVAAAGTAAQRAALLPGIADGSRVATLARFEPGRAAGADPAGVTATQDGDGWRLDGVKEPVPHGAVADLLVVTAAHGSGTMLLVVDAAQAGDTLDRAGYPAFDGTRSARVTFTGTPATPLGDADADAAPVLAAAVAAAAVASCHEAVGAMQTALDLTTEYLRTRKQFGVALRTFQALTFRAADMYVSLELARSTAWWATLVLAEGGDAADAATRAIAQTCRAARHIGQEAIQLHGGIGMTDEYAVGHYTARLTAIDAALGGRQAALARLAARVGEHDVVDPLTA